MPTNETSVESKKGFFGASPAQVLLFTTILSLLALVFLHSQHVYQQLLVNYMAKKITQLMVMNPELLEDSNSVIKNLGVVQTCRAYWLLGKLANTTGRVEDQNHFWTDLMACPGDYINIIRQSDPDNISLAETAVHNRPDLAASWFWLAELNIESHPDQAKSLLREGLAIDPNDGLRWRELGDLLNGHDPTAAIEAYLQSCYNGDPGANGCYRAGLTAERVGDYKSAIKYFRLSRWEGSWQKADELEQRLGLP